MIYDSVSQLNMKYAAQLSQMSDSGHQSTAYLGLRPKMYQLMHSVCLDEHTDNFALTHTVNKGTPFI